MSLRPCLRCAALATALLAPHAGAQAPAAWTRPLGVYPVLPEVTAEDQAVYAQYFTDYLAGKPGFAQALKDAEGKSDPHSIRLQNFSTMLGLVARIEDPAIQVQALQEFAIRAVVYTDRKRPGNDAEKNRHFVFSLEKAVGGGQGMCAEQALTEIVASGMIASPRLHGYYGAGYSHGYGLFVVDTGAVIVSDPSNEILETPDRYFTKAGRHPFYVMDADGRVMAVFDQDKKLPRLAASQPLTLAPLPGDALLLKQVEKAGDDSGKKHPILARPAAPGAGLAGLGR